MQLNAQEAASNLRAHADALEIALEPVVWTTRKPEPSDPLLHLIAASQIHVCRALAEFLRETEDTDGRGSQAEN